MGAVDVDDLYGLPLDRFVPERAALARELRAASRRDEAAAVAALRKPSVAAWAVNQLVRSQPRAIARLLKAGQGLRDAQTKVLAGRGRGPNLRTAAEHERTAVDELVKTARGLLTSDGHELSTATLDRVGETLNAAALDEDAQQLVRGGWLRAARLRLDAKREQEARPIPKSRPARLKESKRRLEEELAADSQANAAFEHHRAHGRDSSGRRLGAQTKPYSPPATPEGKINTTDPDSRLVKTKGGWIQGYNAQAAVNETGIVLAAEVTVDSPDFGHLDPIVAAVETELEAAGVTDTPEVVLADSGYWHQKQMEEIVSRGIQVLIPPDARERTSPRPGWNGGLYAFMRRILDTDTGRDLYRKRKGMIEPVFGHTKFNRRIDRFQRRGRSAARSEWRLITATHNLQKLYSHQQALATA
jgi:Transposase DDE domain